MKTEASNGQVQSQDAVSGGPRAGTVAAVSGNGKGGRSQGVVALPDAEPWEEAVDGKVLLEGLRQVLRRFVVLPKWAAETLALWTLHSYAFQLREVSTYIGVESPEKRCGKTTLLSVLSELVNRPVVAANISSPAFFRVIEETRPTLLIDEADTLLLGNDELRGILNSGYTRKTAYVVRVTSQAPNIKPPATNSEDEASGAGTGRKGGWAGVRGEEGQRLARFSCWCPKVMAAIGRLPDTLADRCIVIRMQRKTGKEECERLRGLEATMLRRQCARFVRDHEGAIAQARPEMPKGLNDRAADIWEPLVTLADLAGGEWPELARRAAVGLSESAQGNNPIGALLLDIFVLFSGEHLERMFSRRLVDGLNRMEGRPWQELPGLRPAASEAGKQMTEYWLAQRLRPYGVRPRNLRIDGERAKGYVKEELMEVFRRYIPKSEVEALRAEWNDGDGTGLEAGAENSGGAEKVKDGGGESPKAEIRKLKPEANPNG